MHEQHKGSLLQTERSRRKGYETAKGNINCPDRHLRHRYYGGTGYEKRPLWASIPKRPDGSCCLHSL